MISQLKHFVHIAKIIQTADWVKYAINVIYKVL